MSIINLIYNSPNGGGGGGWQPGANTILYLPLNGDATNYGSSYTTSTYGSITYPTVGTIQVGYFNGSESVYIDVNDSSEINQELTYSFWIKVGSGFTAGRWVLATGAESYGENRAAEVGPNNYRMSGWFADLDTPTGTLVTDTWQYLGYTINPSTGETKIYINGVLSIGSTLSLNSFSNKRIAVGSNFYISSFAVDTYMSNVIVENQTWTGSMFSDYFNQTKSLYGIS